MVWSKISVIWSARNFTYISIIIPLTTLRASKVKIPREGNISNKNRKNYSDYPMPILKETPFWQTDHIVCDIFIVIDIFGLKL